MDFIVEYPLHIRISDIIPPILPSTTHQRKSVMTPVQLFLLEDLYGKNRNYNMDIIKEAALYTGLEEETVEVWLKNRRYRPKRKQWDDINKSPMNKSPKYSPTLTNSNNQCKALDNPVKTTSDMQSMLSSNISCSTFTNLDTQSIAIANYLNSTYSTTSILEPFTTSSPKASSSSCSSTWMNSDAVYLGNGTLPHSLCSSASSDFETQIVTSPKALDYHHSLINVDTICTETLMLESYTCPSSSSNLETQIRTSAESLDSSCVSALMNFDKQYISTRILPGSPYLPNWNSFEMPTVTSSKTSSYSCSSPSINFDTTRVATPALQSFTHSSTFTNLETQNTTSLKTLDHSCSLTNSDTTITVTLPDSPCSQTSNNLETQIVTSPETLDSYCLSIRLANFNKEHTAIPSSTYPSTLPSLETQTTTSSNALDYPCSSTLINMDTIYMATLTLGDSICPSSSNNLETQIISSPQALDSSSVSTLMKFDKQYISTPSLPGSTYSPNWSNVETPIVTSSSPSINLDAMCIVTPSLLCFTYSTATTNFETQTTTSSKALDPSCSSTVMESDAVCLETVALSDSSCLTTSTVFETQIMTSPETLNSSCLSTRPMSLDKEHISPTLPSSTYPSALTNLEAQIMTSPKALDSSGVSTLVNFDKQYTTSLPGCSNFLTPVLISSSPPMNSDTMCMMTSGLPSSSYSSTFTNVETQTVTSHLNTLNHSYSSALINSDTEVTVIFPDSTCSAASKYLETQNVASPETLSSSCLSTLMNLSKQCTATPTLTLPRYTFPSTFTNLETQTKISQETSDHSYSLKLMNLDTTCSLSSSLPDSTCSSASGNFQKQTVASAKRLDALCLSTLMKLDARYEVTDVAESSTWSSNDAKTQTPRIPKNFDSSSTLPNFGKYRKISQLPPNYSASQNRSKRKQQNCLDNERILEDLFNQSVYPDKATKYRVAMEIGLNMAAVNVWFNNRRRKYKRMHGDVKGVMKRRRILHQH